MITRADGSSGGAASAPPEGALLAQLLANGPAKTPWRVSTPPTPPRPDNANCTNAEIKSCCRPASLLDVPLIQAAQNVVPVAVTAADKIESLRNWAFGRCLSADRAGVYARPEGASGGRVRKAVWELGLN